jgi:hypothetical protein
MWNSPSARPSLSCSTRHAGEYAKISLLTWQGSVLRYVLEIAAALFAGTGGPCKYTGRSMKEANEGMGVKGADFGALVEDLQRSLNTFKVPVREQSELLAILGPMKIDSVTR